jgi:hypothetical protein
MPIMNIEGFSELWIAYRRCHMNRYEIRNEKGLDVDEDILERYYGNSWRSVLDRLNHKYDGYLMTIHHQDFELHIYRVLAH